MTTRERTAKLPPLEKIATIVSDLDELRSQVDKKIAQEKSLDELVDIVFLDELSEQCDISIETMKKKLKVAGGQFFKLGKRFVMRKICFLEVLEKLEQKKL